MRAEHAPVDVHLVNHHILQVGEELRPAGVVRQDAGVQHVRVGDDDPGILAHFGPGGLRCVAVVGAHRDVLVIRQQAVEGFQFGLLVLGQRFGREQVQRPAFRQAHQAVEHRQVVGQGLAAGRPGHQGDVLALPGVRPYVGLMAVQAGKTAPGEHIRQRRVQVKRDWGQLFKPRRDGVPFDHIPADGRLGPPVREQRVEGRHSSWVELYSRNRSDGVVRI